jgi:hypothetical protein
MVEEEGGTFGGGKVGRAIKELRNSIPGGGHKGILHPLVCCGEREK